MIEDGGLAKDRSQSIAAEEGEGRGSCVVAASRGATKKEDNITILVIILGIFTILEILLGIFTILEIILIFLVIPKKVAGQHFRRSQDSLYFQNRSL